MLERGMNLFATRRRGYYRYPETMGNSLGQFRLRSFLGSKGYLYSGSDLLSPAFTSVLTV